MQTLADDLAIDKDICQMGVEPGLMAWKATMQMLAQMEFKSMYFPNGI